MTRDSSDRWSIGGRRVTRTSPRSYLLTPARDQRLVWTVASDAKLRRRLLGRSRDDGELGETTEYESVAMTPVQLLGGDGQSEPREAEEQRTERELAFHPGQCGAEAEVDAVSERDVVRAAALDVECLRVDGTVGIPVG